MATKLLLTIQGPSDSHGSHEVLVEEDFDTVINKVCPIDPPRSNLEHQQNVIYHKADGTGRISIVSHIIAGVEENGEIA